MAAAYLAPLCAVPCAPPLSVPLNVPCPYACTPLYAAPVMTVWRNAHDRGRVLPLPSRTDAGRDVDTNVPPRTAHGRGPREDGRGTAALRAAVRDRRVRDLGPGAAVLAAARSRGRPRSAGTPHGVVARGGGDRPGLYAPLGVDRRTGEAAAPGGTAGARRGHDHGQLGRLHLGRGRGPRRGGLARLLHQSARDDPAGGRAAQGTAAGSAVGCGRRRRDRRGGHLGRVRAAAVDLAGAGVLVRHVRPGQEEGRPGRPGVARGGDDGAVPARSWLPAVAGRDRRVDVHRARHGPRSLARLGGAGHGRAAGAVRRVRHPRTADDARAAPVPHAGAPAGPGRRVLPRGHVAGAVGRVRAGVDGAGHPDVGRAAHGPPHTRTYGRTARGGATSFAGQRARRGGVLRRAAGPTRRCPSTRSGPRPPSRRPARRRPGPRGSSPRCPRGPARASRR